MATIPPEARLNENEHPVFMHAFDESTRQALMEDDAFAWRSACSVLITIVSLGLLLGVFAVIMAA